jgi:very-short-patch-repair endonuclease
MVHDRVDKSSWLRLAPRVYALPSAAPTWRRQYKAAELSTPGAAIAGLAAAKLHGFDGFRTASPELVVPYTSQTRNTLAQIHRARDVPTTLVDGIRVTTVAQTLFDLMPRLTLDRLEKTMDGQLLTRGTSIDDLDERRQALDLARRPGINTWRMLMEERSEDGWIAPESELESTLFVVLKQLPSEPELVRQATMPWWKPGEGRVDGLLPEWRTIVEADGRRWHARMRDFDNDRWRDNVAQSNGYRVLRFTYTHLNQRPDEVVMIVEQTGRWRIGAA